MLEQLKELLEVYDAIIVDLKKIPVDRESLIRLQSFRCRLVNLQVAEMAKLPVSGEHILPTFVGK